MIEQLLTIIRKDLKMLLRSKSATAAVLIGPLVLVLLVGLVFTNAGDPQLVVGVTSENFIQSQSYIDTLDNAFEVIPFEQEAECVQSVRTGTTVSCVSLRNGNPPQAIIHVDPTDANVVYAVIDQITGQIENQTSTIRGGFASTLLQSTTSTAIKLEDDVAQLAGANTILQEQVQHSSSLASDVSGLKIDVQTISPGAVSTAITVSVDARDTYRAILEETLDEYEDFAENDNVTSELNKVEDFRSQLEDVNERVAGVDDRIFADLIALTGNIEQQVQQTQQSAQQYAAQTQQIQSSLASAQSDVEQVLGSITESRNLLSTLNISQNDITNPIEPVIEPVTAEGDDFGFLFPYFLVLIVMFTSVLLASNLIVKERQSQAYFRNFTTPTPEWVFVLATFLTTAVILLSQLLIVMLVASWFVAFNIFGSFFTLFLLLILGVSFFTLLGMLIGYVFKTHEAVMLASIALSSLFLFVSNLVLPVETIPGVIQSLINANPMVLVAELIKSVAVFNFGLGDIWASVMALLMYIVILFTAIMIIQRLTRIRYFEVAGASERISRFLGEQEIPEGKELQVGEWTVASKDQLLQALKFMSDEEYEKYASHKHNIISDWVLDVYKDEDLSNRLRNKSRKGAIQILEKVTK